MTAATEARKAVLAMLVDAGIPATMDAGAFYPQPAGVLVGLPSLTDRTLAGGAKFEVPVLVVSGDPLSSLVPVDRLYALADDCARVLSCDTYQPSSYSTTANAEPLPAILLTAVALATTTTETED